MINVQIHLDDLKERIETIERILDVTHLPRGAATPISREARGLTVVLLFAAYENLLYSLTRTLLEGAVRVRVGNGRLQPGFRAFAMEGAAKSARDMSEKKLFSTALPKLVDTASPSGRACTINTSSFPSDGSFMKRTQIQIWCDLFRVPHPQRLLHRTWQRIDTVVSERKRHCARKTHPRGRWSWLHGAGHSQLGGRLVPRLERLPLRRRLEGVQPRLLQDALALIRKV